MKALLSQRPGGPETLIVSERPDPTPAPGEILIAVAACGINYPDVLVIEDKYQFHPERPFAPGGEVAGLVEAVGEGVTGFKLGQPVIGSAIYGGLAEKMIVAADRCYAMPDRMPMDECCCPLKA